MKPLSSRPSGILSMIGSSLGFSIMALCVKFAAKTLPSLEIVFFRSLIGTLMILSVMFVRRIPVWGSERRLLILRGLSGFLALSLHFYTIARLPLSTAVMLNYTGPIFAVILATFFLGERPGPFLFSMILISFSGVYLLVEGKLGGWNFNVFLALLSAVFAGIAYALIRVIKKRESPLTVIFYFTALSTIGSSAFLAFGFRWPDWKEWLFLAGVGFGSFWGQLWMTVALRQAPASLVSPFFYLTPLLTYFYGVLFFNEAVTGKSLLGTFLIILGGTLISYFEMRRISNRILPAGT